MPFKKGVVTNPNGRPKKPEIEQLRKAIAKVQKDKDLTLLEHFVEQSYKDNKVLIALIKKFCPDLSNVSGDIGGGFKLVIMPPDGEKGDNGE